MKITRLEIDDFRAFPGPEPYVFDFAGKNALIYGENGSGKTSVFHALREFFEISQNPRPFHQFKHRYSPHTDGFVAATFSDGSRHQWCSGAERPISVDIVAQTARRKGCLDYRALLRTNFLHGRNRVNIFQLVVEELWRDLPLNLGIRTATLGELWQDTLKSFPKRVGSKNVTGETRWRWQPATRGRMGRVTERLVQFNEAFRAQLPTLQGEAQRLLDRFLDRDLSIHLSLPGVGTAQDKRGPHATELWLDVHFRNHPLLEYQNELNEARLTALALALHAAALRTSIPPDPLKPRLLVLDDVLIGLDLSNRMPLLAMLHAEFSEWQIVLLTHDPVWFEMAREFTEGSDAWTYIRLFDVPHPHYGSAPRLETDARDLVRAKQYLAAGDMKASAVYARSAFEKRLRKVCADKAVRVRFRSNPKHVSADDLWQGIVARNNEQLAANRPAFIDANLQSHIEAVRSVVLNELSHSRATSLTARELGLAIQAVEEFERFRFVP